jgi:hypothetical protein
MGVMCSLLGHDYGAADVERERTEQGEEVVRTAKRVERCHNCGHERTVSENTEVTSLSAAAGVVREPDGTVVAATNELTEAVSKADGGVAIENGETERVLNATESTESVPADADKPAENSTGIDRIHTDASETHETAGRAPGEWPAEPDEQPSTTEAEPPRSESSDLSSSGSVGTLDSRVGRWPGQQAETETNQRNGAENATDAGVATRAIAGDSFGCASCGFSAAVVDSPLRAGDICPDCGHGYLAQETRKG